jgi:glycine betaine/proline transport system ATP-binding protein
VIQDGDPQDIIMRPADDYISDFIKDINRGRVIKVSTLMTKAARASGPKFETTALLEDVLTTLNQSKTDSGAVVDGKGKVVGKITMKDAIQAMARPQRSETGTRYK